MRAEATRIADERLQYAGELAVPALRDNDLLPARRKPGLPATLTAAVVARAGALPAAFSRFAQVESELGTGFLFLPVFMALGAVLYFIAPVEPTWVLLGLPALAASGFAFAARSRQLLRAAAIALLTCALGMLAAKVETWRAGTTITGSAVTTRVTGRVIEIEHRENGRTRLTLELLATERPELRHAPERVRLTTAQAPEGTAPGLIVSGVARLMPPSGPVRPDSYDFAFESYFDRLGAIGFFLGDPVIVEGAPPAGMAARLSAAIEKLRLAIAARVDRHVEGPAAPVAAALIAGVRSGIPEEINEALRRTGLAHILSISGLHMALVAGTVMVAMRTAFALFPGFSSRRPVKKYAAVTALAACSFYLAISGAEVAAQRSFIMLAVMLLALLFDHAAITLRNLAIAALVVLAVSPHEVMGPSFQMSFAATAALIGGYAAWSDWRAGRPRPAFPTNDGPVRFASRRVLVFVAGLTATSIIAGLATTIYGVYHFSRVSPYGLGANLAAMPLVTFVVMPMAVLSAVLMPLGLEAWPLQLMGRGIDGVIAVAGWFAARSPIDAVGLVPPAALVVMSLALAVATLTSTRLRLLALPLAIAGIGLMAERRLPDVLIAEDARLVAMRDASGALAANRARPNDFTFDNWMRAVATGGWHRPVEVSASDATETLASETFQCSGDTCIARHHAGALIVFAKTASAAASYCVEATLIVIDDATAQDVCDAGQAFVVTKRDTARRGSATVYLPALAGGNPGVRFSIAEPYRPWHEHRRYSREARGLPPYRRDAGD